MTQCVHLVTLGRVEIADPGGVGFQIQLCHRLESLGDICLRNQIGDSGTTTGKPARFVGVDALAELPAVLDGLKSP